ncbi:uncharacterized protein HD556DRAFT_1310914 [Suillus plorans]|uniref:DUF6532 domain-containing protein n=1 Tax=Suillus plorans TaxID=116603 RepID=A0A9P7DF70_9AGAM|nr:uncharacterized protein HD556DRAFT_1310914 [Suillus plorans]KAG1790129.1 hypothetical protein HD556DRAFT_1310914 [Suillus plorans]
MHLCERKTQRPLVKKWNGNPVKLGNLPSVERSWMRFWMIQINTRKRYGRDKEQEQEQDREQDREQEQEQEQMISLEDKLQAELDGVKAHYSAKRLKSKLGRPAVSTGILVDDLRDAAYATVQAKIVAARPSQICSELKSKVQSAVIGHYGLHRLLKSKLEAKIAALLHEHAYVFRNLDKWLRKRGEATHEYAAAFNPVPLPTLALIATAIECGLRDYIKGFKEIGHLCTLQRQEQKHPQLILKLQQEIFQIAYDSMGDFEEVEESHDYLGEFDLEADMMDISLIGDTVAGPKDMGFIMQCISEKKQLVAEIIDDWLTISKISDVLYIAVLGTMTFLELLASSNSHPSLGTTMFPEQPSPLQRIVTELSVWWRVISRKMDRQEHTWVTIHDSEPRAGPAPPRPDSRTGNMLSSRILEGHDWSISSDYWDSSRPYRACIPVDLEAHERFPEGRWLSAPFTLGRDWGAQDTSGWTLTPIVRKSRTSPKRPAGPLQKKRAKYIAVQKKGEEDKGRRISKNEYKRLTEWCVGVHKQLPEGDIFYAYENDADDEDDAAPAGVIVSAKDLAAHEAKTLAALPREEPWTCLDTEAAPAVVAQGVMIAEPETSLAAVTQGVTTAGQVNDEPALVTVTAPIAKAIEVPITPKPVPDNGAESPVSSEKGEALFTPDSPMAPWIPQDDNFSSMLPSPRAVSHPSSPPDARVVLPASMNRPKQKSPRLSSPQAMPRSSSPPVSRGVLSKPTGGLTETPVAVEAGRSQQCAYQPLGRPFQEGTRRDAGLSRDERSYSGDSYRLMSAGRTTPTRRRVTALATFRANQRRTGENKRFCPEDREAQRPMLSERIMDDFSMGPPSSSLRSLTDRIRTVPNLRAPPAEQKKKQIRNPHAEQVPTLMLRPPMSQVLLQPQELVSAGDGIRLITQAYQANELRINGPQGPTFPWWSDVSIYGSEALAHELFGQLGFSMDLVPTWDLSVDSTSIVARVNSDMTKVAISIEDYPAEVFMELIDSYPANKWRGGGCHSCGGIDTVYMSYKP